MTNFVIDQMAAALARGRPLRPEHDAIHLAVLQALDELRREA